MTKLSKCARSRAARRLKFESLEHRRLLTASMEMFGDTLFIRGSMEADQIAIVDYGDGRVTASNSAVHDGRPQEFTNVMHVLVRSKKGDDSVSYSMPDPSRGVQDIVVCMGPEGNNAFQFIAGPSSRDDTHEHHLTINGGANSDRVALNFSQGAANWIIRSDLRGGDDQFAARFVGDVNGTPTSQVQLNLRGGDGDDRYDLDFTNWIGTADVKVDLGAGNDTLRSSYVTLEPGRAAPGVDGEIIPCIRVAIDGGDGQDAVELNFSLGRGEAEVKTDMGRGDDTFALRADSHPTDSEIIPCIRVALTGGDGNDSLGINLQGFSGNSDLYVDAGAGNDSVRVLADPPPDRLTATLRGGEGNDAIEMIFSRLGRTTGESLVSILGDAGDDSLLLDPGNLAVLKLRARLDGGSGFDRAKAPRFASVVNVEARTTL
ncbi:MAG: hypothetical protein ABI614_19880 [Planctomycetota bacterium]